MTSPETVRAARRCSEWWDIPWPGHGMAVLTHRHCRRLTRHPSGKCWQHLSFADRRAPLSLPAKEEAGRMEGEIS